MSDQPNSSKQKLKKYLVYAFMIAIFSGCIWLIFKPSKSDLIKANEGLGYNDKVPDPTNNDMMGDKRDAYEQASLKLKQNENSMALSNFSSMLQAENEKVNENKLSLLESNPITTPKEKITKYPIESSVNSYKDINRTLGTFYEQPKVDPEKEDMKRKLEELEERLNEKDNKQNSIDDQLVLMEKSFQMAAKYMPGQSDNAPYLNEKTGMTAEEVKNKFTKPSGKNSNGKTKITPIKQIKDQPVSALKQNISNQELYDYFDQPRNFNFNTIGQDIGIADKNTITACIHGDQTIIDGQSVFIRLLESVQVGNDIVPKNTILTGLAKLQGERLDIMISSIEYNGVISTVKMAIYDIDGTKGVYVPGSMEMDAAKEMLANMGTSMGTSVSITKSAGSQIASDLSKGVVQGTSQYFAKKIKTIKINLKAGHKVLLFPQEQEQ